MPGISDVVGLYIGDVPVLVPGGGGGGGAAWELGPRFVSSLSVTDKETNPTGVTFSPDGTKMFVVGTSSGSVHRYDLSTPWNINTATFVSSFWVTNNTADVTFSPDGTKMFIVTNGGAVQHYGLSTPWSITSASHVSSLSVAKNETSPYGVTFSPDGTKMFIIGTSSDSVRRYNLSTPWSITSASHASLFSVAARETNPTGVTFSPDGTKMFVVGFTSDSVHRYDLSTPWDVTSASHASLFSVAAKETNPYGVTFSPNGTKMFIVGTSSDSVHRYDLRPED